MPTTTTPRRKAAFSRTWACTACMFMLGPTLMLALPPTVTAEDTATPAMPDRSVPPETEADADIADRISPAEQLAIGPDPDMPQATVTLIGGAQVTGTLLRRNDAGVVIDLGHDVVHVPTPRIIDVREHDSAEGETESEVTRDTGDIFRVGSLEPAPIPRLVRRFGDSVVTIRTAAGLGSGFIISEQGHLITNYHVIENETTISVSVFKRTESEFERQETRRVRVLALQPLRDLALLQIDLDDLDHYTPTPLVIAENHDVEVGDLVFAIGNPLGLERSVTQGIISSTTRTLEHLRLFQTDAAINPGNSGGPMFNARGEVVGVVCAGAVFFDGLAFGIPASDLIDFLRNREAYLYDPSQPQNGIKYIDPPFRSSDEHQMNEQ